MGGFVWYFPDFWENAGTPPLLGGGVRFFAWVGELLILVDHQCCSWAEAVCRLCLGMKKYFFFQVDHSKAGDEI